MDSLMLMLIKTVRASDQEVAGLCQNASLLLREV